MEHLYVLVLFLACCCVVSRSAVGRSSNLPLVEVISDHRPSQEYAEKVDMAFSMIVDFFQNELPYIRHGLEESCIQGYANLANSTDQYNHSRLLRTLDAFGKLEAGLLEGNVVARGNYDECLGTGDTQYCLLTLDLSLGDGLGLLVPTEAICVPVECTVYDIEWATGEVEKALALVGIPLKFNPPYCTTGEKPPYSAGAVAVLVVCSLFLCLIAVGTFYDTLPLFQKSFLSSEKQQRTMDVQTEKTPLLSSSAVKTPRLLRFLVNIVQAFSLYKTLPAILSTAQPPSAISCINGMRVISMFWVIMGHVYVFASEVVANPLMVLQKVLPSFTFQGVENAVFAVDTFFFLSGLLTAYLTLREMHRRNGRFPFLPFYIHRYLRLTPSIAFLIFFSMFMAVYLSDGPYYLPTFDSHSLYYNSCRSYWWTNLLYINNFHPSTLSENCVGWTWYLANDMQFFVVSPLMLILLYHSFPIGLASVGVFLVSCLAATLAISAHYKLEAGLGQQNADFIDILYTKPYCRIFPYLAGLLLGYLLHKKFAIRLRSKLQNLLVYLVLWALAAFFCLSVVYGLYGTLHGHPLNEAENVLYLTFSRLVWGIGLALVVFACHNGYGWVVNSFLSMGFWVPLSRLTFNAYLVHPIVLSVIYSSLRAGIYYTTITVSIYIIAVVVLSYAVAGVIAVCVEFPISNVEMAVFELLGVNLKSRSKPVR